MLSICLVLCWPIVLTLGTILLPFCTPIVGGNGEGMEMGRSVYEQPRTKVDGILSQQGGFQVSKGKRKGSKKE